MSSSLGTSHGRRRQNLPRQRFSAKTLPHGRKIVQNLQPNLPEILPQVLPRQEKLHFSLPRGRTFVCRVRGRIDRNPVAGVAAAEKTALFSAVAEKSAVAETSFYRATSTLHGVAILTRRSYK